jgi:hypothetical protein
VGGNVVDRRLAREVAQSSDAGRLVEGAADREDERKGNSLRGGREKKNETFFHLRMAMVGNKPVKQQ